MSTLRDALDSLNLSAPEARKRGAPLKFFDITYEDFASIFELVAGAAVRMAPKEQIPAFFLEVGISLGYRLRELREMERR